MMRLGRRPALRRILVAGLVVMSALVGGRSVSAEPEKASTGLYLASVHDLDFAVGKFSADFWIWSNVASNRFSPIETAYIVNEADKTAEPAITVKSADKRWDQRRIRADLWADWKISRFPFDSQELTIVMEDSVATTDDLVYVVDRKNSGIAPGLKIPGWHVVDWDIQAEEHPYKSNFGDPANPNGVKSPRLVFKLTVQRDGIPIFIDMTIGAFVAFGIMCLSFRLLPIVPPIYGARMVIIVGSLFTVMTSMRVFGSSYAFPFGETLPNRIHLVTLAAGFLAALGGVLARRRVEAGDEAAGMRADRRSLPLFIAAYVVVVGWMVFDAVYYH